MTAKDAKGAAFGVWVVWRSSTREGQGRQVTHTPTRASLASLAILLRRATLFAKALRLPAQRRVVA